VPQILKRFREAVLEAAVSGRLTEQWRDETGGALASMRESRLGDLLSDIRYGTATKCSYEQNKETPVLRIPNVAKGRIDTSDLKYGQLDKGARERLSLLPGDLLVVRSNGSLDLVGRTAVVPQGFEGFAFAGYLIRLRPNPDKVDSEYVSIVLGSPAVRAHILVTARSTSGVNNLNSEELRRIVVPLPDAAEQVEIVRRVHELFALADSLDRRYRETVSRVERLTPSVLAKAFRGELVPQDPGDEPASELLKRIQEMKKSAVKPKVRAVRKIVSESTDVASDAPSATVRKAAILSKLLKTKGRLAPEKLLQASGLDIDDFYDQLKTELVAGRIREVRKGERAESRWLEYVR
jgi:type I restriction enzyme S subunit